MKARFEMSLWERIKAASLMWWAIVVTGEIELYDDEKENEEKSQNNLDSRE